MFVSLVIRFGTGIILIQSHFADNNGRVITLKDGRDNCINDSRSVGVRKERVQLTIPSLTLLVLAG